MAAPSLAVFKVRLDGALSTLVWWKMSLLMAGGLEPDDLQGPFQPKPFYDSICSFHVVINRANLAFKLLSGVFIVILKPLLPIPFDSGA